MTAIIEESTAALYTATYGKYNVELENRINQVAREHITGYTGGLWDYHKFGGCHVFMAPTMENPIFTNAPNWFSESMDRRLCGIVCTMYALAYVASVNNDKFLQYLFSAMNDAISDLPKEQRMLIRSALN